MKFHWLEDNTLSPEEERLVQMAQQVAKLSLDLIVDIAVYHNAEKIDELVKAVEALAKVGEST